MGTRGEGMLGLWLGLFCVVAVSLLFVANYLFNHAMAGSGSRGTLAYFGTVVLPFGIVVPAVAVGRLAAVVHAHGRPIGFPLAARDGVLAPVSLGFGVFVACFPIGSRILSEPEGLARVGQLFLALLMTSVAEVLVFLGVLFVLVESVLAMRIGGRSGRHMAAGAAVLVSALAFGLYHFTYPSPWNTFDTACTLTIVWLAVAALFAVTRSLVAAVVFNNVMAVIGFVLGDLAPPASAPVGLLLGAIGSGAATAVATLSSARGATRRGG